MIQPDEIRSTPAAAISGAVSRVMRPEASVTARPATIATARRKVGGSMLSSSTASNAVIERLGELIERIDLQLDLDEMPGMGARPLKRRADPAGQRDVVVLDQHRVVEAEAVVGAAAQPHRLLFEDAQAGGGLAGADDLRLVPGDRIDQRPGRGRDARQAADQVERGALGRPAPAARVAR